MTNDGEDDADVEAYRKYGLALVDAVDGSVRPWLLLVIEQRLGGAIPPDAVDAVDAAVSTSAEETHRSLTELAQAPHDAPLSGPLERIRRAVQPVTAMLADAGTPPPRRDPVDTEMRPNDIYAIGPFAFVDLSPEVHEAGIAWGAAKAYVHTRRLR